MEAHRGNPLQEAKTERHGQGAQRKMISIGRIRVGLLGERELTILDLGTCGGGDITGS